MTRRPSRRWIPVAGLLAVAAGCGDPAPPTYTGDIAGIVFENCAMCHRPGENAPFPLLTYEDVRRRARQIAEVTESRYMPPWLPAAGSHHFLGDRRLDEDTIATIRRWVEAGAPEGDPADLPPTPVFPGDWKLGPPDLVVEMPEAYELPASGPDAYRNFVIRSPVPATRYVKAIEFQPGNARLVHHAFVLVDPTPGSRRQDEADPAPGFDGIHPPESAQAPGGFFLSWTPGRTPFAGEPGMSWRLEKGTDIVIQLHLQPSGKPETVRSRVGLYFDDGPPTRVPYTIGVFSKDIDIPAGEEAHPVEASYRVPVDVDVVAVLPHAHFLGRTMEAYAARPDGTRTDLISIPQWDFNWQSAYRYEEPVPLPAGTEVSIRYTYDNSDRNPFNPNQPPRRVTYGLQSSDEMCEFWLQVLPRNPDHLEVLRKDYERVMMVQVMKDARRTLARDPDDVQAYVRLGQSLYAQGRDDDALRAFRKALELDPATADAYLFSAFVHQRRGRLDLAQAALERAIELRPDDYMLRFTLGSLHYRADRLEEAGACYREAVRLEPEDFRSNLQLGIVLARTGRPDLAVPLFERCVALRPDEADAQRNLELARSMLRGRR